MSVKWYGDKAKAAARRGAVKGLTDWADEVYDASQEQVPVAVGRPDAGYLKATGQVDVDEGALSAVSYDRSPGSSTGHLGPRAYGPSHPQQASS